MVLIVERRESLALAPREAAPRSTAVALRHMHWHFLPEDASPLLRRRPLPLRDPAAAP